MGAVKEGEVLSVGAVSEKIARRHDSVVETYLVELLRRPDIFHCRVEEIKLVVQHKHVDGVLTMTYGIEIQRKAR